MLVKYELKNKKKIQNIKQTVIRHENKNEKKTEYSLAKTVNAIGTRLDEDSEYLTVLASEYSGFSFFIIQGWIIVGLSGHMTHLKDQE